MAEFPIVDIHTHMFRTPQIGRQALGGFRHGQAPAIEYFGLPEDHLAGMREADVSYCSALAVTPTREMRERALRERGPYGTEQWESNSGLTLDDKLLRRMDHNNAWGCWVGQKFPEIIPFIMVDPRLMAGDQLASYVQNRWDEGARGVKLLSVQTHHHPDDERLYPMYEFMQSINMPLFAQTGGGYGMGQNGISINPVTGDVWGRPRQFRRTRGISRRNPATGTPMRRARSETTCRPAPRRRVRRRTRPCCRRNSPAAGRKSNSWSAAC